MEERNTVTTIFKSNDPEKLVVFHATSLQDQIRFYLNDTQYIAAVDCEEGCSIKVGTENEKEESKKSTFAIIKENPKEFIPILSLSLGIAILFIVGLFYLGTIIDNVLIYLFIVNIITLIASVVEVVVLESKEVAPCLKSKHSAEHMMCNFLEINKRLPKNMDEIKKCSRFSPDCGSRKLVEGIAENFIQSSITAVFTVIVVSGIVSYFCDNSITNIIVFLGTFYLVNFVVGKLIKKQKRMGFIIRPIKKVLTKIAQCANTTSKVKDRDILIAYSVARAWIQVVYPEFYNQEEDILWKQYFKVNSEVE